MIMSSKFVYQVEGVPQDEIPVIDNPEDMINFVIQKDYQLAQSGESNTLKLTKFNRKGEIIVSIAVDLPQSSGTDFDEVLAGFYSRKIVSKEIQYVHNTQQKLTEGTSLKKSSNNLSEDESTTKVETERENQQNEEEKFSILSSDVEYYAQQLFGDSLKDFVKECLNDDCEEYGELEVLKALKEGIKANQPTLNFIESVLERKEVEIMENRSETQTLESEDLEKDDKVLEVAEPELITPEVQPIIESVIEEQGNSYDWAITQPQKNSFEALQQKTEILFEGSDLKLKKDIDQFAHKRNASISEKARELEEKKQQLFHEENQRHSAAKAKITENIEKELAQAMVKIHMDYQKEMLNLYSTDDPELSESVENLLQTLRGE